MCGFAGIVGPLAHRAARVDAMTAAIAHRGPDGQGRWDDEACSLGHRRLAIIDLSPAGAQPMVSADARHVIAFNGEIYDFADHRRSLVARGHVFRSHSDTEVLLALYAEHGDGFAARVEGMFAFALWDRERRRLVLARDRFGQKPLYTARLPGGALAFGSEIGALLALPEVERGVDVEAIDDLLSLHFVPAPRTTYRHIRRFPRATVAVRDEGGELELRSLEVPPRPARDALPLEDAIDRVDAALRRAVRRALVADVPVGLFLSGGVDSSLVASYVAEEHPGPVEAFTATFPGAPTDELAFARQVGERLGLRVSPVPIEPSSFRDPEALVARFDEPFADVAALPTAMLAAAARRSITVALTGDGGDEVFGGYEHHVVARWLAAGAFALRPAGMAVLGRVARGLSPRVAAGTRSRSVARTARRLLEVLGARDAGAASVALRATLSAERRVRLLRPEVLARLGARDPLAAITPGAGEASVLDLFDPDRDAFLPDMFLRKTDVATMSVGFEARAPLLDREVVEAGRSLPLSHLVHGARGKHVLRRLMARRLGPALAARRKMGFAPPVSDWLRAELWPLLADLVLPSSARIGDLVDLAVVRAWATEHRARAADHRRILWALLLLELWLRRGGPARPLS